MKSGTKILGVMTVFAILLSGFALICDYENALEAATTGTAGTNATWSYDDVTKVMTISGTGDMKNFSTGTSLTNVGGIESVVIEQGITSIGQYIFYNCETLTSVTIPDSVANIYKYAFYGCTGLTSVTIPDSVKIIDDYVFRGCTGLTSVTIPSSITRLNSSSFKDCTGLTSVTIPDSVTYLGSSSFNGCTGLTSVTIPDSVTMLNSSSFKGCTGLTSVTIPDGVTGINSEAFRGCTGLTSVTIPDSVNRIFSDAFRGCTGLTSVTILSGDTIINANAFVDCDNLEFAYVPNFKSGSIDSAAFPATTTIVVSNPPVTFNPPVNTSLLVGSNWVYTPTSDTGVTVSVSGASWLSASGNVIYGASSVPGSYSVTVTLAKAGHPTSTHSFTLIVSSVLVPTNSPTNGAIIMPK